MAEYDKTNSGALFKSDRADVNNTIETGNIDVEGGIYKLTSVAMKSAAGGDYDALMLTVGALFKNDKGDNDKRPDHTGSFTLNGLEYKVSSWNRTSKGGAEFKYMRIEKKGAAHAARSAPPVNKPVDADDIPF